MLQGIDVPQNVCAESISTTVRLCNIRASAVLKWRMLWHKRDWKEQEIEHLHVFGSDVEAFIHRDQLQKFDTRSRPCFFFWRHEYEKHYHIYDLNADKILVSGKSYF